MAQQKEGIILLVSISDSKFMKWFILSRLSGKIAELYNLVGRPDVFSNVELKLATDNFSSKNILGEGGYGPVYKVVSDSCN